MREHGSGNIVHRMAVFISIRNLFGKVFFPAELAEIHFSYDAEKLFFDISYRYAGGHAGEKTFPYRWSEIDFRESRTAFDTDR